MVGLAVCFTRHRLTRSRIFTVVTLISAALVLPRSRRPASQRVQTVKHRAEQKVCVQEEKTPRLMSDPERAY